MKRILVIGLLVILCLRSYGQQCTLSINISSSVQSICSGNMVTITANALSGSPPYKYLWNTGETTQSINVNKAATYTVTVTDNTPGCNGVTQSITLTASTTPATPTAADVSICPNTTAALTATAPGGFYQWYDAPTGGNLVGTGSSYTTPTLTTSRTYYVETTINQCTSLRKAVSVNIINPINTADAYICTNSAATLTASGANSYQWYDAASGGNLLSTTSSYNTRVLTTTTTYYVVGTGNGCTSNRAPVTVYVNPAPQAPTAASVSICTGSSASLSATAPAGVVFDWFNVPNGGSSLITSPDFTTPALTATTTYYVQASGGSCISTRTAVTVTVNTIPPPPAASGVTICPGNNATLTAIADGTTHQWFSSAGIQTILASGDIFQTPVLTKTKIYYVRSVNGGCVSSRTAVTVTVNPILPAPSASGQIICTGNTAMLTARTQQGTAEWYNTPIDGNLLSTNATYTTPILSSNTTYYVQAVQSGCSSARVAVQVTVTALPQAPSSAGQTICAGNNATLSVSGTSGSYQWYDAATGGNLLSGTQAYITPALTVTTTYYVQNTSNSGCISARTAVTVTVTPYPLGPTASGVTTCQGTAATLTANTSTGIIAWFDAATGGNQLATGSNFTTPVLQANTTYYVESQSGQCSSQRTAVIVTVTPVPNPLFQYSSGTYCTSAPNPTPVIYAPSGGTFSASPAGLAINPATGQIDLTTSAVGYYVISFTSNGACSTTATTHITITTLPETQFVYNGPYCQKSPNASPTFIGNASGGVFTSTPSGLVFSSSGAGVIDLSQSKAGTYAVTNTIAASGGCPASTFSSPVTIALAPTVNAGPNQTVAAATPVQLAGSFNNASSVKWSGGAGAFSDPTSPTAIYTPATGEVAVNLTLTTNDPPGVCGPQSSSVVITFTTATAVPTAAGTSVCSGSPATLIATAPGGSYQWYDAATGGTLLVIGAVFNTPALTATTPYYVQTTLNGVISARTQVMVTINNATAPLATAGSGCSQSVVTLTASGSSGSYQWYDAPTGGNLLSTSNTYTTPLLIADTTYYVQTTINNCTSPRTRVAVKVNPVPSVTSADAVNVCSETALNYNITADATSTYTWSRGVVSGITNPAVANQTSATITETLTNTSATPIDVTYVIIPTASGCPSNAFNMVVTVYPPSVVTSAAVQTICNNTSTNYTVTFNAPPNSFSWSRAAVAGISNSPVSNQAASTIREILNNTTSKPVDVKYVFIINTTSCPATEFDYVVTVNPNSNITSASSATICSGISLNYIITSNVTPVTFVWSRGNVSEISNPAIANQTSNTITETLINTATYPVNVNYFITPYFNGCAGNSINYTVTVKAPPVTPVINTNSPVCLNSTIKFNTVTVEGVTYAWTGPNGFTSTLQNPIISNVTKANAGTYTLTETGNGCTSAVSSVNVAVDDPPTANAGADQTVCTNIASVNLNGQISGGTTTGVWSSSGTGTFSPASNVLNAQYVPSGTDKISGNVKLTLISTSKDDCNIAMSSITITFIPAPTANAGGSRDVCSQDVSVKLNGTSQYSNHVIWTSNGSGTFSPSDTLLVTSYVPSATDIQKGSVVLSLQAMSAICNSATDAVTIKFVAPPTINAGADKYVIKGQTITLNPSSSDANVHYLWTPNTYLSSDTVKNPIATAVQDITYTLKVTDVRGCVTEDQVMLKILDGIVIPNTFTPNGDGRNDLWNISALNKYPGATVDIYNRGGRQVFHSDGYGIAWDGTFNGKPLPVGVYYYVINTRFEGIRLSGSVTIIR